MLGFSGGTEVRNPLSNEGDAGDTGPLSGSERTPGIGNGNRLQYFCLEIPWTEGGWQAIVLGVAKEETCRVWREG